MKLVIFSPSATGFVSIPKDFLADACFLTNPEEQILSGDSAKNLKAHSESDLLTSGEFASINHLAKKTARSWFDEPEISDLLQVGGVNVGSVFARSLSYRLVALLKALWVFERIAEKFAPESVFLVGAANCVWLNAAKFMFNQLKIPFFVHYVPISEAIVPMSQKIKEAIKPWLVRFLAGLNITERRKGRIVFSLAPKFALPFLCKRRQNDIFLREHFSWSSFRKTFSLRFSHVVPMITSAGKTLIDSNRLLCALDRLSSEKRIFYFHNRCFWPILRGEVESLCLNEMPYVCQLISWLDKFLKKSMPAVVVVDEEVCVFNSILVQKARQLGIATFCLLHGMPFDDVGTLPSHVDRILTWGNSSTKQLLVWGIEKQVVVEVGAPQYDVASFRDVQISRKKIREKLKLPLTGKIMLLGTQPFHTNRSADFLGNPMTPQSLAQMLRASLIALQKNSELFLIVKCHPREDKVWFTKDIIAGFKGLDKRVFVTKNLSPHDLILASDLVVTMGSTLFFEALLLRTPVLFFDDAETRFFPFMGQQCLDLRNENKSAEDIVGFLSPDSSAKRIRDQEVEIESHFLMRNKDALDRALATISKGVA